jgi:glucosamine-6-phosphate deaminase
VILRTFETAEETAAALARRVVDAVRAKPAIVLGLPTGRSPVAAYAELGRLCARSDVDFSDATTFNLDEFVGIPATHPGSFRRFMDEHLFRLVNLDPRRIHFLNGAAPDPDAECERYERAIADARGIDLQIVGIGANGHIGFNEPGDELVSLTHRVTLHDVTRRENAALFGGDPAEVPREALSMGMGTILRASCIVLIATGERKARCVERMVRGGLTTRLPASFLQTHRRVELFLDRGAARLLEAGPPRSSALP